MNYLHLSGRPKVWDARIKIALSVFTVCTLLSSPSAISQGSCPKDLAPEFRVELWRLGTDKVTDRDGKLVSRLYGDVGINGQNIGRFYENPALKIPIGTYRGELRYRSNHNFVQSACGQISRAGDFLLEVADVKDSNGGARSNILLHPGALPSLSQGCVLMGARKYDANGIPLPLEPSNTLVKMRRLFYGTDDPIACPNKRIVIVVRQ